MLLWTLACSTPAEVPEPGGCCSYRCADGHVVEMGAQPENACDLEADMVCEERNAEVAEVVFDPSCQGIVGGPDG
ncbi:MAG TPA: hypothetical protein QGF58_26065 [Myxococcota bacterium]|jgi:hypothetical protein|nr:hypothetical protein [Myxococcota bacterium]